MNHSPNAQTPVIANPVRRRSLAWLSSATLLGLSGLLAGCASPDVSQYAREQPVLDLRQYLSGDLQAHGIVTGRSGQVTRRFVVKMQGRWDGDKGVLDEHFVFSDGERQRRVWHITDHGQGRFTGRADDVVGEAQGQAAGNALRWAYTLALPVDGKTWHIQFDDWMFLVDEKTLINRATMSKFGIRVGEVTLFFTKP